MKKALGITFLVLLAAARDGPRITGEQSLLRGASRSTAEVVEPRPVRIRLNLSLTPADLGLSDNLYVRRSIDSEAAMRPLSTVKLLDAEHFSADLRRGRVEYRIEGLNPLGASIGGQLSTNTAKITFSWSSAS